PAQFRDSKHKSITSGTTNQKQFQQINERLQQPPSNDLATLIKYYKTRPAENELKDLTKTPKSINPLSLSAAKVSPAQIKQLTHRIQPKVSNGCQRPTNHQKENLATSNIS